MKESDRNFFRQAHHRSYRAIVESMFGWDEAHQDNFADIDFNERNPHIIIYNSKAVGVVGWQEKITYLWFGPFFILPEFQNAGIGSLVIKEFIEQSNHTELPIRLQTLRQNLGAKKLYEKLGFHVLSLSGIHWQMEYSPIGGMDHV